MSDPISMCELALALGLTVGEITHGRGTPMSAHELTVIWPTFFAWRARAAERDAEKQRGRR
jgi:hypothetical protein